MRNELVRELAAKLRFATPSEWNSTLWLQAHIMDYLTEEVTLEDVLQELNGKTEV